MCCCQASCNRLSDCTSDPSATSCRGGPSIKTLLVLPYCITAVLTHFVTCRLGHPHYRRKCRQNSRVIHCRNRRRFLCGQPWKRSTQHHNLRSVRCGRCMYRGGWPVAMARLHIGDLCASVNDIIMHYLAFAAGDLQKKGSELHKWSRKCQISTITVV